MTTGKVRWRAWLAAIVLAGVSFAPVSAGQFDEAALERQLEQVAILLGLGSVDADQLKERVAEIGGLAFERAVPIDFMPREELGRYLRELFAEEYPPDYAEREERALRGFGFLDPGEDLRTIRETVLNENIAGFYDERPGVKKLFAISSGRELTLMNQLVLSHELRHAVQDQHIVIREQLSVRSDYDDRRLAALCLIEGDASVLMEQYLSHAATRNRPELGNLFQAFSQGLSGSDVAEMFAGPALAEAPAVVQEQLVAPYFLGRNLAVEAFERGGFELLNELLRTPPRSTEQVLHPEKYLDTPRDEPAPVAVEGIGSREVEFDGTMGELLIRVMLEGGPAAADAETAAAGWGGDAYAIVVADDGYDLLWSTAWDTLEDAQEFESALRRHAESFSGEGSVSLSRDGTRVRFERYGFR